MSIDRWWDGLKDLTYETLWGSPRPKPTDQLTAKIRRGRETKETPQERRRRLYDERRQAKRAEESRIRQEAADRFHERLNEYVDLVRLHVQAVLDCFLSTARPNWHPEEGAEQIVSILPSDAQITENIASDFRITRLPQSLQIVATEHVASVVKQAIIMGQSLLRLNCSHFQTIITRLGSIVESVCHLDKDVRPETMRAIEKGVKPPPAMVAPQIPEIDSKTHECQAELNVNIQQAEADAKELKRKLVHNWLTGVVSAGLDLPLIFLSILPRYEGTSLDIPGLIPLLTITMTMTAIILAHLVVTKRWWSIPLLMGGVLALGALRMPDINSAFSKGISGAIASISLVIVNILAIPTVAACAAICFHKAVDIGRRHRKVSRRLKVWRRERDIAQQTQSSITGELQTIRGITEQANRNYRELVEAYPTQRLNLIDAMSDMLLDQLSDVRAESDGFVGGLRIQVMEDMEESIQSCGRELARLSWLQIEEIPGGDGHKQTHSIPSLQLRDL